MTTIEELLNKFKDSASDRTLAYGIEISAKVTYMPTEILEGYTILDDGTRTLEAVPAKRKVFEILQSKFNKEKIFRFKGRLDKTEFGNIAFAIEEIIE